MKQIYVVLIHYVLLFAAIFGIKYYTETPNTNCGIVEYASSSTQALYMIADDGCKEKVPVTEETYNKYVDKRGVRLCLTSNICDHKSHIALLIFIFFAYIFCGLLVGIILFASEDDDGILSYFIDAFNFFKYLKI